MHVELTQEECAVLIAVLTYAEGEALVNSPPMCKAIASLRPMRSALVYLYLRSVADMATKDDGTHHDSHGTQIDSQSGSRVS